MPTENTGDPLPDISDDASPTKGGLRHAWNVAVKRPWTHGAGLVTVVLGVLVLFHLDSLIYLGAMQVALGSSQFASYFEAKRAGGINPVPRATLLVGVLGLSVGGFLIARSQGLL